MRGNFIKIFFSVTFFMAVNTVIAQNGKTDSSFVPLIVRDLKVSIAKAEILKDAFIRINFQLDSLMKRKDITPSVKKELIKNLFINRELKIKSVLNEPQQEKLRILMLNYAHDRRERNLSQNIERQILIQQNQKLNTDRKFKTQKNDSL